MKQIKQILLRVQEQLSTIAELNYIDRDWGQFTYETPPVKFPCAIVDASNGYYSHLSGGGQLAEVEISVTIATQRLTASSVAATTTEESFAIIDLMERVHTTLQHYHTDDFAPLTRTGFRKLSSGSSYEVYTMTYATHYKVPRVKAETLHEIMGVKVKIVDKV